jgi:hypothetical protein
VMYKSIYKFVLCYKFKSKLSKKKNVIYCKKNSSLKKRTGYSHKKKTYKISYKKKKGQD